MPAQRFPANWLVPQWPAPANVRAVCTSRNGGSSLAPYDCLNLGQHVGDAADAVQANRTVLANAIGVRPVFLQQVHGNRTVVLEPQSADDQAADGALTRVPGLACTSMVADCLPVLLTDRRGSFVAALHAGWRGLAGAGDMQGRGILETFFDAQGAEQGGKHAGELIAWLGPCIGPLAFEVGDAVRDTFMQQSVRAVSCFAPHGSGKWLADLAGLARQRLAALGVDAVYGNDGSRDWCTVSQPSRFFSHRRDRVSGRFAACIWLD